MQGRIADGTLFPNISAKIQDTIEELVGKTFRDLRSTVDQVMALILFDVEMALDSRSQSEDDAHNLEDPEVERRKADLIAELHVLKVKHEELIASISGIEHQR